MVLKQLQEQAKTVEELIEAECSDPFVLCNICDTEPCEKADAPAKCPLIIHDAKLVSVDVAASILKAFSSDVLAELNESAIQIKDCGLFPDCWGYVVPLEKVKDVFGSVEKE